MSGPRSFLSLRDNSNQEAGASLDDNSNIHSKFPFCRRAHKYDYSGKDFDLVDIPQ